MTGAGPVLIAAAAVAEAAMLLQVIVKQVLLVIDPSQLPDTPDILLQLS